MKEVLKYYKDFPKEGIVFVDIIPFMQDKKIFTQLINTIGENLTAPNIAAPMIPASLPSVSGKILA